jgi:hypothetical protein
MNSKQTLTQEPKQENGTEQTNIPGYRPKLNYQDFQDSLKADRNLFRLAAAKHLDIPLDTMGDITVTNTKSSNLTPAVLGIGGTLLALYLSGGLAAPAVIGKVSRILHDYTVESELVPPETSLELGNESLE